MVKAHVDLYSKFLMILDTLAREEVEYVLVGGYAVILHGLPRLTQDMDLFIKPDESNIRRLRQALLSVFDDESIAEITLDTLNAYPVVRYGSPEGFYIDLIVRLGTAFTYDDLKFDTRIIDGRPVRIASAETLYEMKKDTVRPKDRSDSYFLRNLINKRKDNG